MFALWFTASRTDQVAIIVPYRNREIHLKIFTNYMATFLHRQNSSAKIYVIEQVRRMFNEQINHICATV